ncbi:MAG: hypothetical protein ACYCPS_03365 [Candidatus Saccharimonadales bacterium]
MAMDNSYELWNQFSLAENCLDPAGGILYAIRYDTDSLEAQQKRVVEFLIRSSAQILPIDEGTTAVDISYVELGKRERVQIMLEELSVVNEAIEHHNQGLNIHFIEDLAAYLKNLFIGVISSSDPRDKLIALNLVDLGIPGLADDLLLANLQNQVLTDTELATVLDLRKFASTNSDLFNTRPVVISGPMLN